MPRVLVSVIVPVYRIPENFLRKCLESLLSQTLRDVEFLLIDDGSPDDCGKICDAYARKDSRMLVIHKENEGVSVARNLGLKMASGRYVTFVDADDWCDERMLEVGCAFAERNTSDVVFCSARKASKLDELVSLWPNEKKELNQKERVALVDAAILPRSFEDGVKIAAWGKIYRTSAIRGFFEYTPNVKYGQDNVFNLGVFQSSLLFSYCPDACYYYQDQNPMQTMCRYNPQKYEDVKVLVRSLRNAINADILYHYDQQLHTRKLSMILMNVLPQQFFHPDNKECFFTKYSKFKRFVNNVELQNDLQGDFVCGYFSLFQKVAICAMKHKLWFLFIFVELKWLLQRKLGLWRKGR